LKKVNTMLTTEERAMKIARLASLPALLCELVNGLSVAQLTTHYLAGEWTVAQNVHHLGDSHMNSFIRVKLILTEDHPTLRPYDQDAWALTPEANDPDLTPSLTLLTGLHARWVRLFSALDAAQWRRTGFHPENGDVLLEDILTTYAAHGEAHIDQIRRTLAAAPH
jgi:hypothetical protein